MLYLLSPLERLTTGNVAISLWWVGPRIASKIPTEWRGRRPAPLEKSPRSSSGAGLRPRRGALIVIEARIGGGDSPIRSSSESYLLLGASTFLASTGLVSSFLGVAAAGPLALRISSM